MTKRSITAAIGLLLALLLLQPASAQAPALKVLTTGAFKPVVLALVPAFEARKDLKVDVQNDTAGGLARRIAAGESFDVVVLTPAALQTLAAERRLAADSITPLAQVAIGVAVKSGAPQPAIGTIEQFKSAVLRARRVAYIDPASGGSSGLYLQGLFERLGIAEAVRAKALLVAGGLVAERLVSGEADLAIHQISEILAVPGVTLVGPLPEAIQNYTRYAGAVSSNSSQVEAAKALLGALAAPEAEQVIRAKGMLPAR